MDKLELLSQRIAAIIAELKSLREENAKLREDLELRQMMLDDMQEQITLQKEADNRNATQMEAILDSIESVLPSGGAQV